MNTILTKVDFLEFVGNQRCSDCCFINRCAKNDKTMCDIIVEYLDE